MQDRTDEQTKAQPAANSASDVPDHVHVALGHSEHEGDIASGPVYRGERPPAADDETAS